ncbi:MAG: DeoR/GlpR transcriptional regulator [Alphaproteobacteria bacterium]|nr:MAG: DeoR/GlpR transcriptional regulator [Alphaproteobacteria bacterium]
MKPTRKPSARQLGILRHLKEHGRASVDDLAAAFSTTPQTIRKDLNALADANQIIRFHGGAALAAGTEYTSFEARMATAAEEKAEIGRRVAREIPDHASVIINAGTTTAAIAPFLGGHVGLKVVSDSVFLANELRKHVGLEVMVPGGVVRGSDGAILGETAIEFISQFRADIAIVGAAAIAQNGELLDYDLREASVSRAIIASARTVILAADGSKFGNVAPVCFGHLRQVDALVTSVNHPAGIDRLCRDFGVRLLTMRNAKKA